jgi:hypothetical protein
VPLLSPQRDQNGNVVPHDHEGIVRDDGIIRRISEQQIVTDSDGRRRISSIAFNKSSALNGGMSVDIQKLIEERGVDARQYVTTPRWTGSVRFEAGALRQEGFQVGFDPLPDNPFHGEVWGEFTKRQRLILQSIAIWFVEIPGVMIK